MLILDTHFRKMQAFSGQNSEKILGTKARGAAARTAGSVNFLFVSLVTVVVIFFRLPSQRIDRG